MGSMATMNHTGDSKVVWDRNDDVSVDIARASFDAAIKKGYLAYSVTGRKGDKGEQIRAFNPEAEAIILAPALAGG